jgi:hypothetical protein
MFKIQTAIKKANQEQKDRLLELVIRRENVKAELADLQIDYKKDRKALEEPLGITDGAIFALLEEIATGQKDLFHDPTNPEKAVEEAPADDEPEAA